MPVTRALHYGDNLYTLREMPAQTVDLVYLDPPFNSNATYNVLFRAPSGQRANAQIQAFEDTWHWGDETELTYGDILRSSAAAAGVVRSLRAFMGENDLMAYLVMMTVRLIELRRVLKRTGSVYLHCDPTASHYLKIIMDGIFGASNFRNEIIWKRTSAHSGARRWGDVHDTLLFYSAGPNYTWNQLHQGHDRAHIAAKYSQSDLHGPFMPADLTGAGIRAGHSGKPWKGYDPNPLNRHWAVPAKLPDGIVDVADWGELTTQEKLDRLDEAGAIYWPKKEGGFPRFKRYLSSGIPIQTMITDISPVNSQAEERLGYATQKPLALLERILRASSNPGDLVLDPFCGCGTAVHAAERLERSWVGMDVTHLAIQVIEQRLQHYYRAIDVPVSGRPTTADGARDLAFRCKHQFELWAVWLARGFPRGGGKKGKDRGVDGDIYFRIGDRDAHAVISVKGGVHLNPGMIRDLKGTREREGADIGIFVCLEEPTAEMRREAAASGIFETDYFSIPRIQAFTVAELLAGQKPLAAPIHDILSAAKEARRSGRRPRRPDPRQREMLYTFDEQLPPAGRLALDQTPAPPPARAAIAQMPPYLKIRPKWVA